MSVHPLSPSPGPKALVGPLSARALAADTGGRGGTALEPVRPVEAPGRPQHRFASRGPRDDGVADERRPHAGANRPSPSTSATRAALTYTPLPQHEAVPFLVQLLGQGGGAVPFESKHRDAARLGSDAYRAAGAEPPVYSEAPSVFRVSI